MNKFQPRILRLFLFTIFFLGFSLSSYSQDKRTTEALYTDARQAAFEENNYKKARQLAYKALERSPDYHGIRVFVARTLAWDKRYDEAREELKTVLAKDPTYKEALRASIDVEKWSEHPKQALAVTNNALNHYPEDLYFLNQRAGLLHKIGNTKEAKVQLKEILSLAPTNSEARKLLKDIKHEEFKYEAKISYRTDQFTDVFDPWHFGILQLRRSTPIGSIIGRVRYGSRFATNGVQYEVDAYPSITKGLSAYLNAGYSSSSIFPQYRFGISLYKSLPRSFQIEGGLRYLDFESSQVTIYTASLSKYYGSYLFTVRTYIRPSTSGTSTSFGLLLRRYFGGPDTYIELNGSGGSSPADIEFQQDIQQLNSWDLSLGGQIPLNYRTIIEGSFGYDFEEFPNYNRKQLTAKISLSYQF